MTPTKSPHDGEQPAATRLAPGSRVLVTGAAGGLGRHVVQQLLDAGYAVRAHDRQSLAPDVFVVPPDHPAGDAGALECVTFEYPLTPLALSRIDDDEHAEALEELVAGCAAVVHTAALVSLSETYRELYPVNVAFVDDLFTAARRQGLEHFVHLSCASIYRGNRTLRTEASDTAPVNGYEQTKHDSEDVFRHPGVDGAGIATTAWTILRPALLYGPGCTSMGAGMVTLPAILGGFMSYLPGLSGGPRSNWCHVEDAARAVLTVLGNPDAYGRCFNVADDTALSFGEALTSIAEAYGFELGPSVPFPNAAIWALASPFIDRDWTIDRAREALRHAWRRVQARHGIDSPLRPRLDRNALFYVNDDAIIIASALKELGWSPQWPSFQKGIVETVTWYQDQGWVPRFDLGSRVELLDQQRRPALAYREQVHGPLAATNGAGANSGDAQPLAVQAELELEWMTLPGPFELAEGHINGRIFIEGLADGAPVRGIARARLLPRVEIVYDFGFDGADGLAYRFVGLRRLGSLARLATGRARAGKLEGRLIDRRASTIASGALSIGVEGRFVPLLESFRKSA